jgi:predicted nucleic acid-binding Zn ribbon protein
VKKRLVTLAAGAAIVAAAAVPTGSAFARRTHTPGPAAKAAKCAVLRGAIADLTAEKAATSDVDEKALIQALIDEQQAKFTALGC